MAVLQPRKDSWRWQTSNGEYGKFYGSIHREVVKNQEVHKDCAKKCEALSEELQECKSQLEKLKITCGRQIVDSDHPRVPACTGMPTSPKLGHCECPSKPGPLSKDMYVTEQMNQYNGAEKHDPQMLMDHIKAEHPRLVKRVRTKLPLVAIRSGQPPMSGDCDEDNADTRCCRKVGCGSPGRSSSRSKATKRKVVHRRKENAPKKQRGSFFGSSSKPSSTAGGAGNLPSSQRYNFYRYYGYAGQGAKTSKGWHTIKNPWIA